MRSKASTLLVIAMLAAACGAHTRPGTADPRGGLAARYLAIATVGNRGLERALDALDGRDRDQLDPARLDLHAAAAVERRFDHDLLALDLPSALEATAHALVNVNESRATLTSEAAASASIQQLRRYERQLSAADAAVEKQVRRLRKELGLPPPETS